MNWFDLTSCGQSMIGLRVLLLRASIVHFAMDRHIHWALTLLSIAYTDINF